jgi:hypothetical protein
MYRSDISAICAPVLLYGTIRPLPDCAIGVPMMGIVDPSPRRRLGFGVAR